WWDNTLPFRVLFINALTGFAASNLAPADVNALMHCLNAAYHSTASVDYPPYIASAREELLTLMNTAIRQMPSARQRSRTSLMREIRDIQRQLAALSASVKALGLQS